MGQGSGEGIGSLVSGYGLKSEQDRGEYFKGKSVGHHLLAQGQERRTSSLGRETQDSHLLAETQSLGPQRQHPR